MSRSQHFMILSLLALLPAALHAQVLLFGNFTDLGDNSSHAASYLLGSQIDVTIPGVLTDAGIIFRASGGNGEVAVYDDTGAGGLPGNLVARTGVFPVTSIGDTLIPFTSNPVLPAGTYWMMAVYSTGASVGFTTNTDALVAYRSFTTGTVPPATFGTATTYTGQAFNYYLRLDAIPEPETIALQGLGLLVLIAVRLRKGRSKPAPQLRSGCVP